MDKLQTIEADSNTLRNSGRYPLFGGLLGACVLISSFMVYLIDPSVRMAALDTLIVIILSIVLAGILSRLFYGRSTDKEEPSVRLSSQISGMFEKDDDQTTAVDDYTNLHFLVAVLAIFIFGVFFWAITLAAYWVTSRWSNSWINLMAYFGWSLGIYILITLLFNKGVEGKRLNNWLWQKAEKSHQKFIKKGPEAPTP